MGRREATRKKQWRDAPPGAERLALGLQLIDGSKQAFERQQSELDALHRAQEAAEHQLDADVRELTHEAERLHAGGIEGLLRNHLSSSHNQQPLGNGVPENTSSPDNDEVAPYELGAENAFESKEALKKRQADAYAVEMALSIKRGEREKKKRDLEAEFASAFAEVQRKRDALSALEERLADMEQIRMQKDREFARLQRHLMELLEEQKLELENLREKGIELETATATSAAAAAATAAKAREHEARSHAMFESTEELMKFQFMSMSLSYFSSLNMLKNLRDINADTTAAAITTTAETAATAAAAAAAANIAPISAALAKQKSNGNAISNLLTTVAQRKQQELAQQKREEEEALAPGRQQPLPELLRSWTVDDVGRWLDSLSLPQYKAAFKEGAVDGEFLMELSAEDVAEVLGVSHKLHVRKLLIARNKLLPLTSAERTQLDAVNHEVNAARARGRGQEAAPGDDISLEVETVFSQARNGRMKRLVESLDAGFPIDSEDDKANTLLLLACQNVNQRMVELLVTRHANVNHRNAQGNTPLHFAMAYDGEGVLGEYLIAHGADDTIENNSGLTPYDGLTAD
ncbi:hypothetical protein G195_002594 [Phytophthora kernoviae 00238/432]|uniref:SAM domain-containing protein n=1 Tax=Phytophthora kernoviae 00238/432 TaxID=1284355 RepID=A0A8J4SCD5_9STRA|nr:hypothetical protein G195_002594 [Phytophthora kernoviae 00238/432]